MTYNSAGLRLKMKYNRAGLRLKMTYNSAGLRLNMNYNRAGLRLKNGRIRSRFLSQDFFLQYHGHLLQYEIYDYILFGV